MRKISLAFLITTGVLAVNTFAQNITSKDLQQLLNERNITSIQEILQKNPENGEAYYTASLYYSLGDDELGTNKNEGKKLEFLKKAADLGFSEAQLQYGFTLLNNGDSDEGIQYLIQAANGNSLRAITMLGDLYFAGYQDKDGKSVIKPNIEKSIQYLERAANQGDQDARYTLGYIYLSGELGYQDIGKALGLLEANIDYEKKSAHLASLIILIDLYNESTLVEFNREKLIDYNYLASLQDYMPSVYAIGVLQRSGEKGNKINVIQDHKAAFINLEKAMYAGYIDAMFRIGEMYFNGEGTEQSDMNAYIWMAIAEDLSGNKTNYSETILELIPKRQRQIAIDNKNHYRQFFTMPKAENAVNAASNIQAQ